MPLVANTALPTFERLRREGELVVPGDAALHQDIRELHIGLLNMMPGTARGREAPIISGANVTQPDLAKEPFWEPLIEVIDWASANVTSTICSCLATHAVLQFRYAQKRKHLGFKRWGVFPHRVVDRRHPLVADVNTRFDVPHSRFNEGTRAQFEQAGLAILVESETAGVHLD